LTPIERSALNIFRDYLIGPGEMLCFHGPILEEHADSLRELTAQGLMTKERHRGSYSLTEAGFAAMQCDDNMN
jgi:hypothetical protein